jgi:acyl-CoA thioester hydrolase
MTDHPDEHRLRVRYAETDQMGVAHHASDLVYLEEGRTRLMAALGCSYAELERQGIGLPVRRLEMRYRAAARYDEEILVRTRVAALGPASVRFEYELERPADGARLASGWTELACIALSDPRRPVRPLPDSLRSLLAGRLEAPPG